MKKWICLTVSLLCLSACTRYQREQALPERSLAYEIPAQSTTKDESDLVLPEQDRVLPEVRGKGSPVKVKGVYISAFVAGTQDRMDELLEQIAASEINTVVIDVKDDEGRITFAMDSPMVAEIGAAKHYISDIEALITQLKAQNLYVIARVTAFRDPFLAEQKPEWGLQLADHTLYRDKNGMAWVNPYKKEVWDYLIEISQGAKEAGFDEIQYDYIRFSTEQGMEQVVYQASDTLGREKTQVITEFMTYVYEALHEEIYLSADVFGTIIGSEADASKIGQSYIEMAATLDYISPMIYPSHYAAGNFGLAHPDLQPYHTVLAALERSRQELSVSSEKTAVVRPWLQDFTASYLKEYRKYGGREIREQIQAVYDAGYEEWILWNASCNYSWDGLVQSDQEP